MLPFERDLEQRRLQASSDAQSGAEFAFDPTTTSCGNFSASMNQLFHAQHMGKNRSENSSDSATVYRWRNPYDGLPK